MGFSTAVQFSLAAIAKEELFHLCLHVRGLSCGLQGYQWRGETKSGCLFSGLWTSFGCLHSSFGLRGKIGTVHVELDPSVDFRASGRS